MTVIPREVYDPGGLAYILTDGRCKPLAPNVARLLSNHRNELVEVTWDMVMADRRERQAQIMERKRDCPLPKVLPCFVWTFFNEQDIPFHGWYCYVVTRHFDISVNFIRNGFKSQLAVSIMTEFPCGFLPLADNFNDWMPEFTRRYPRAKHRLDPRKAGSAIGWLTDRSIFTCAKPQ
jgi:hypothetical protein